MRKSLILTALLAITALNVTAETHRDPKQKYQFRKQHPCPLTGKRTGACTGYVIDHIKALDCGGADHPSNMQWQTVAEGKLKDKTERIGCRL